ncbi:hypothetical protein TNCV_4534911 [Trichonephila clavipes]|nr:hypothetical protein TNCV_4534911 [Trichonephila clavipes]
MWGSGSVLFVLSCNEWDLGLPSSVFPRGGENETVGKALPARQGKGSAQNRLLFPTSPGMCGLSLTVAGHMAHEASLHPIS